MPKHSGTGPSARPTSAPELRRFAPDCKLRFVCLPQRSAVQRSAVQRSAAQCSAAQRSAAQCSAVQWPPNVRCCVVSLRRMICCCSMPNFNQNFPLHAARLCLQMRVAAAKALATLASDTAAHVSRRAALHGAAKPSRAELSQAYHARRDGATRSGYSQSSAGTAARQQGRAAAGTARARAE